MKGTFRVGMEVTKTSFPARRERPGEEITSGEAPSMEPEAIRILVTSQPLGAVVWVWFVLKGVHMPKVQPPV